ncbi:hypothetical protein HY497_01565 [Candidatus Woesearchaeota archaeon]|nr:hypothetical protein [Candidatus Woesearchaeota archaeon]
MDGVVYIDKIEMGKMSEALEFFHCALTGARYGLPAPTQKEMKNRTKRIELSKQRYSFVQNADGMYNPVIDTIILSFALLYERFMHELQSPTFVRTALDYAFAHECVHWDLGGTAPAVALRSIPSATHLPTTSLYGKKQDNFIGRIGEAKAELESGCIIENANDVMFNAVLKRMRISLRYQLEEGLCYAVEHTLHDDHDEAPFAQYSLNGNESIMRAAYAWAQDQIKMKGIKSTIQRVKAEINDAFEQDKSPVEFVGIR